MKLAFVATLYFLTLVISSPVFAQLGNANSPLGTNLNHILDYSTEFAFVDAFKASRDWVSKDATNYAEDKRPINMDDGGWVRSLAPNQFVETYLFSDIPGLYPSGKYIVLYDGEGEIRYGESAIKDGAASRPGRDVVSVDSSHGEGIIFDIVSTNPNNYLRNIRFLMPGGICNNDMFHYAAKPGDCSGTYTSFEKNYQTQIFHPFFLNSIKDYRAIRFLHWIFIPWAELISQDPLQWQQRPKLTDARWSYTHGVPVEIMVDLCNRLHTDGWFNFPHLATDDYIRQFAIYVRDHLGLALKSYIEYSNEVWNMAYPEEKYAEQKGMELHLSQKNDSFEAGLRYYSQRSVEVFNIWYDVYKKEAPQRVVRVLASQAGNPWTGVTVMDWKEAYKQADVFGIAPYMSLDATASLTSVDEVFANLKQQIDTELSNVEMKENIANVKQRGLIPVAYEIGMDLVGGDNQKLVDLYLAVNRDPRMKDLYTHFLQSWKANGGALMMHMLSTMAYSNGGFGSEEYYNQPLDKAPKRAAILDFMAKNPCWWEGCNRRIL